MEPSEWLLRYPTALDLPEQYVGTDTPDAAGKPQVTAAGTPEQMAGAAAPGVSIDRRVFRPLRRTGDRGRRTVKSQARPPSAPPSSQRPRNSEEESLSDGEGQGYGLPTWQPGVDDNDFDPFDLDVMLGLRGDEVFQNADRRSGSGYSQRRPGSAPASGRYSTGAGRPGAQPIESWPPSSPAPRYGVGPAWTPSPKRRGPPRSDPMSRGAEMRQMWSRDRFLQKSGRRKFDLRGCGESGSMWKASSQQNSSQFLVPSYVPPHEKRRDALRTRIHQQMLVPDLY